MKLHDFVWIWTSCAARQLDTRRLGTRVYVRHPTVARRIRPLAIPTLVTLVHVRQPMIAPRILISILGPIMVIISMAETRGEDSRTWSHMTAQRRYVGPILVSLPFHITVDSLICFSVNCFAHFWDYLYCGFIFWDSDF